MSFREELHDRARRARRRVVLVEGWDPRVQAAADVLRRESIAEVITLDPDMSHDPMVGRVADLIQRRRPDRVKGESDALRLAKDPLRFGAGLVALGLADAAVAGATYPTADVVRAALWLVGAAAGVETVSSAFYMVLNHPTTYEERVLTFTDAGVVPEPTPDQLAQIALAAAGDRGKIVGDVPVVGFLSYSTHGSAAGARVDKVRWAADKFRRLAPDIRSDGELQGDAAVVPEIAQRKAPRSVVAGEANILVFPDLDSGNIAYKLVQHWTGGRAIGPIVQGLAKPVADLSRGAAPSDIVDVASVAVVQSLPPSDQVKEKDE